MFVFVLVFFSVRSYLSIRLLIVSYRILSFLFCSCFCSCSFPFNRKSCRTLYRVVLDLFVSLYLSFFVQPYLSIRLVIVSNQIFYSLSLFLSPSLSLCVIPILFVFFFIRCLLLPVHWNFYAPLFCDRGIDTEFDSDAPLSQGERRHTHSRHHLYSLIRPYFNNCRTATYCYRSLYSDGSKTWIFESYRPVRYFDTKEGIRSEYKELRLSKAARSPQHHKKEVGTRNRYEL